MTFPNYTCECKLPDCNKEIPDKVWEKLRMDNLGKYPFFGGKRPDIVTKECAEDLRLKHSVLLIEGDYAIVSYYGCPEYSKETAIGGKKK